MKRFNLVEKMKITPLEIRQKTFEKKLRGYDKDEVNAFLLSMSNEWERLLDENKELRIKLEQAEKEVRKLREVESSLFKTLKTAEDTGANMVEQANKAAELHLKETQMNAEAMLSEAKSKAKNLIEKAEMDSRQVVEEMQEAVKELEQNYRNLENLKENVLAELKNFSEDLNDRIDRTAKAKAEFKIEDHAKKVKDLARETEKRIDKEHLEVKPKTSTPIDKEEVKKKAIREQEPPAAKKPEPKLDPKPQPKPEPVAEEPKEEGSFFDQLED